jgi:hypothetical protein
MLMQTLALAARNHAEMDDTAPVAGPLPADKSSFGRPAGYGSAFGACRAPSE